jgi:gliding motility associated protien GldN
MASLRESIMFWIPFDQLRPYMAMQYAIPNRNEVKRVTYDEFFQKRLFTSYIVGEGNMYNRWIPDYSGSKEEIRKEQNRIATELLNFEQDLWEY